MDPTFQITETEIHAVELVMSEWQRIKADYPYLTTSQGLAMVAKRFDETEKAVQ